MVKITNHFYSGYNFNWTKCKIHSTIVIENNQEKIKTINVKKTLCEQLKKYKGIGFICYFLYCHGDFYQKCKKYAIIITCQVHIAMILKKQFCNPFSCPRDILQYLKAFLVVITGDGCYWQLVGRGQGCC